MKTKVHTVEKEALQFAKSSFNYLFFKTASGLKSRNINKVLLESFRLGKINACERILTSIEENKCWVKEHITKEIFQYLSEIDSLGSIFKKYNRTDKKIIEKICFKYLEGEVAGSKQFIQKILKNNQEVIDRNDTLAHAHLMIINENNLFVEYFKKGQKIDVEFFTNKYLERPELLAQ